MSTIDPDAARRERDTATPAARRLLLPALVVFLLPAMATLTTVRMIANAENDVFDAASVLALVLTFPGACATILAIVHWALLASRNPRLLDVSAPLGLALLGAALGLSATAPPPAWVRVPTASPPVIVLLVIGALVLAYAVFARAARIRRIRREDEIMRASSPVTGTVTNQGYDHPTSEARAILTTVTYAFADAAGTRRFVQKRESVPMKDPIVNGERVDVWFDRADPSNTERIVVRRRRPDDR